MLIFVHERFNVNKLRQRITWGVEDKYTRYVIVYTVIVTVHPCIFIAHISVRIKIENMKLHRLKKSLPMAPMNHSYPTLLKSHRCLF